MLKKNTTAVELGEISSLQSLVVERHELQKEILMIDREIQKIQEPQVVKAAGEPKS